MREEEGGELSGVLDLMLIIADNAIQYGTYFKGRHLELPPKPRP